MKPVCDICLKPVAPHHTLCDECCADLLADRAGEPMYTISLAYAGKPMAVTVGIGGIMATMPQLDANLYMLHCDGRVVADATKREDGSWIVEFYDGLILSPGCMIV